MKKLLLILMLAAFAPATMAQQKPAYVLYNAKGKKVSYKKMIRLLAKKDIVLFGEYHNNAIAHWLELEVAKDLTEKRNLVFGAEMFEADNQQALNNYLSGKITAKGLDSTARLWNNYKPTMLPS